MLAVTHVGSFLVRRQVELLFLCPQVLLCLIAVRVCSNVRQFSSDVCVTLVNISLCWSLLLWFAELFALNGDYKTCAAALLEFRLQPESYFSDFTFQLRNIFCVSSRREISEPLWLLELRAVLVAAELYNLQLLLKGGEINNFILTAKQAFLPFDTCVISSPPGMYFHVPSCPIPRVSSSVS